MPILPRPSKLSYPEKNQYHGAQGAIIIIVYSEQHFRGFFDKHCGKADSEDPEYTVVVLGEEDCPSEDTVRQVFEKLVTGKYFEFDRKTVFLPLPHPYKARNYNGIEDQWLDEKPGEGNLRIEGCHKLVSRQDYARLLQTRELTPTDIGAIDAIKEKAKMENLIVKFTFYLGHIDVIKFRR